jgi:hypothetical protein
MCGESYTGKTGATWGYAGLNRDVLHVLQVDSVNSVQNLIVPFKLRKHLSALRIPESLSKL